MGCRLSKSGTPVATFEHPPIDPALEKRQTQSMHCGSHAVEVSAPAILPAEQVSQQSSVSRLDEDQEDDEESAETVGMLPGTEDDVGTLLYAPFKAPSDGVIRTTDTVGSRRRVWRIDPGASEMSTLANGACTVGRAKMKSPRSGQQNSTLSYADGQEVWHRQEKVYLGRIVRFISAGGFGEVYEISNNGDTEAMKCVKTDNATDGEMVVALIAEAMTLVTIGRHPNIVQVRRGRALNKRFLLFMEYVNGGTLSEWITDNRLYTGSNSDVQKLLIGLSIQLASGLQHIHSHNVIHQDFKPANILMTRDGEPKITDYGTCLRLANYSRSISDSKHTVDGASVEVSGGGAVSAHNPNEGEEAMSVYNEFMGGTPAYWSPEQANEWSRRVSDDAKITRRTDLWSWALTVIEMYAGERFWKSGLDGAAILDRYRREFDQKMANRFNIIDSRWMPPALDSLLEHCLKTNPDERPYSVDDLLSELLPLYQSIHGFEFVSSLTARSANDDSRRALCNLRISLGVALLERSMFDRAVSEFHAAMCLCQDTPIPYVCLGNALRAQGSLEAAVEQYKMALSIDPNCLPAHNNYGLALDLQGKLDSAILEYREAIAVDADYAPAHNNLGLALQKQSNLNEAIEEFLAAIRLDAEYTTAIENLSVALRLAGRPEEAVRYEKMARSLS
eukprot:GILK01009653.1.p1 GENE.GILK01009653.1~~GILK01009653.1.p1  ORF type:complete len:675 (-),score=84.56 GILK01009653.1:251-2275(-)